MSRVRCKRNTPLTDKYPPSPPCSCKTCVGFCARPGWWTVAEAAQAIKRGYGTRMMLEIAPEFTFGVLSPAFRGCEMRFALNAFAHHGCTFLAQDRCELYGTGCQPLECRYCHHDRPGLGPQCHADLERDWNTSAGQALILRWAEMAGLQRVLRQLLQSAKKSYAPPRR